MSTELVTEGSKVLNKMVYLMIKAIDLRCIHDDAMKGIKIVIELLLKISGRIDLFRDPNVPRTFQKHHLFLLLEFTLCLVRIEKNHGCQGWIFTLSMENTPTNSAEGEGESNYHHQNQSMNKTF